MTSRIGLPGDRVSDPHALIIQTKRRNLIPNVLRLDRPLHWQQAAHDMMKASHPAIRLRRATSVYNCLGMVFASRRTWVEETIRLDTETILQMVLQDDGFRRLHPNEPPMPGDLVVYRQQDHAFAHIGVMVSVETNLESAEYDITVLSKWGEHGEYIHGEHDVPHRLGTQVEYFTDRR